MITDSFKHKGLRRQMIDYLRTKGISDERVLQAMNEVPRHFFLDSSLDVLAYQDRALSILCEQTISQPSTVAFQTQLLNIQEDDKVLEIGTGSGYQTCVLCKMKARVYTIERYKPLHNSAQELFSLLKCHPKCFFGDGYLGLPRYAPFDKIIVTCGADKLPEVLLQQMKVGGVMVIPIGNDTQTMYRITKTDDNTFEQEAFGDFKFVPMLQERKFN
ncbi:MAG: protein-L-isoaspartate(D-aspartate) O-methyltransferase [Candidatus Onthomorpha sp.]|nr:protein-L-isoaspartate(D-aspartate) O-methyltransferase [Bacteroidales bacterium]MDY4932302.1 protein-L-isoaspartate(D-aspartate) O-methyltransferase [Candidatus Onthomorpha sp.]MDY5788939.1 protein-L-isoaspartate(D-aspartate) O-methyltransferase [Candidatus Onthomorpha sp.]MDY5799234.1 protein-L-isoaspartate(D-aspartate) O-methyltransferase [Candidatus Onthomorpha sp.]